MDESSFEKYQKILIQDPGSKLFAPLAEAYRERGLLEDAAKLALQGVEKNPQYVPGYTVLARILQDQTQFARSLEILNKAMELSSENLLVYQLMAEAHLHLKQPELALKAYKMALFLNPLYEKARRAIEKLETLTAHTYDEDLFQYKELNEAQATSSPSPEMAPILDAPQFPALVEKVEPENDRNLKRNLGLLDAWIVRNELDKAKSLLQNSLRSFPHAPELLKRAEILGVEPEKPELLEPLPPREKTRLLRQIKKLQAILHSLRG